MILITGETYTRDQIHASLGGEKVTYLPQKGGKIVCGCFSTDSNPEAPLVILVGGSQEDEDANVILKKANLLLGQGDPIPVFLKRAPNEWLFDGYYRAAGATHDPRVIDQKQRVAGRNDVVMVLYLEAIDPPRHAWSAPQKLVHLK
jgi:hypothetical protein